MSLNIRNKKLNNKLQMVHSKFFVVSIDNSSSNVAFVCHKDYT